MKSARLPATLCCLVGLLSGSAGATPTTVGGETRPDLLTLSHGAVPVRVMGSGYDLKSEDALRAVDGGDDVYAVAGRANAETTAEFVYALPAATVFDRFAIPNVLENPRPSQTFFRHVEVWGSAQAPDNGFELLASGDLTAHEGPGQVTELALAARPSVRWIKLRLVGGLDMQGSLTTLEFSELIGNGTQEPVPTSEAFLGNWHARGLNLELHQSGAVVSGCYGHEGRLNGTVSGNILHAVGRNTAGVQTLFVLGLTDKGAIRGLASTKGSPFRPYEAPRAKGKKGRACAEPPPSTLGCGSIVHGIRFDADSDALRADAAPLLDELYRGLSADPHGHITIEGHTSGGDANGPDPDLSTRRAAAVRAELLRRGLAPARVVATGVGAQQPIASDASEIGRSLNRRIEVRCD